MKKLWDRLKPIIPKEAVIPVEFGRWWRRNRVWKRIRGKPIAVERTSEELEYEVTEPDMKKLIEFIGNLRTSTKSGFAGLAVMAVMATPLAEPVNAYLMEACASPEGPLPFLVAGGVTWAVMYVSARVSKTKHDPGLL